MRWNIDPILIELGPLELRWYGLFFALGLFLTVRAAPHVFERRGLVVAHAERMPLWLALGMLIGAHLVHLVFYEPRSFIDNPKRILQLGSGLASHGGGLGTVLALYWYCRKHKLEFMRYLDAVMIVAIWIFPMVRIGNFFNSEIVGRVTDVPWGVIFERRGDMVARHPSQLYEAAAGFGLLGLGYWLDARFRDRWRTGAVFFAMAGTYSVYRFVLEYFKEFQVLSSGVPLTMGQLLTLPLLLLSLWALLLSPRFRVVGAAASPALVGAGEGLEASSAGLAGSTSPARTAKSSKKAKRKPKGRR